MACVSAHVYLDVDGVLNAVTTKSDPGWGWGESEVARVMGFQIRYSPAMVAAINEIAETASIFWLTTWRDHAVRFLAPAIGLNGTEWPILDAPEPLGAPWWKLTAIRDHVERTQPEHAFWIDDDIRFDQQAREWLDLRSVNVTPICPRTEVGLTCESLDALRAVVPS